MVSFFKTIYIFPSALDTVDILLREDVQMKENYDAYMYVGKYC